jgi:hypothetical protein
VPLLVVSPYTDAGTVSGSGVSTPDCKNASVFYCHDFGSILKFIENNFSLSEIGLLDALNYADHFAPDNKGTNVPLSEFFTLGTKRTFYQIPIPTGSPTESYFTNYTGQVEPDNED